MMTAHPGSAAEWALAEVARVPACRQGGPHGEDLSRGHQLHRPDRPDLAGFRAGSAAAEAIPIAVIASARGWLGATALQQRATPHESGPGPAS